MGGALAAIPFAGSVLRDYRHVCAFFTSPQEEYETLLPFICDGLRCGDRAYHVLDGTYQKEHLDQIMRAGVDVEEALRTRQLEVATPQTTYLRTGRFSKSAMLTLIQDVLKMGRTLGFPLTRLVAHAETVLEDWSSVNEWVEYEMLLNEVLPDYRDPVICTYDANLLDGPLALDILRTHPVAIVGGVLVENAFFATPEEFLREVRGRPEARREPYRGRSGGLINS